MTSIRATAPLLILLLTVGCTVKNNALTTPLDDRQTACWRFYRDADHIVFAHGVEDSGEMRVSAYPFLRSNRFLASFDATSMSTEAYAQWLELLRRTDQQARMLEFANLPAKAKLEITSRLPVNTTFRQRLRQCGRILLEATLTDSESKRQLARRTAVPDDYQSWQRIVGLYPLARWFAEIGIDDLHRKLKKPFHLPIEQIAASGRLTRYRPDSMTTLSQQQVGAMLAASYRNPLKIPLLAPDKLERLFAHFAPVWEIDTRNETDLVGAMTLDENGRPKVDGENPTVYVKHAYTRYHGENLLQLIYQIWMPAREKTDAFDLYGGELDSVIWRVTLNRQGLPIAYDSIHACGCYYLLFPGSGYRALSTEADTEPVLAPKTVMLDPYRQRPLLRLASRTHYLQQIAPYNASGYAEAYRLQAYDHLRSLPSAEGQRRSLFGPDGIVEKSRRSERFLLWPFGVASPGAMRQWGSHAIAFIGRRHFDDPYLLVKLIAPQTPE
ncbi:hypothetical protein Q9L42_005605 [Methylomarinum sp. Ch1-1]|uniref:Uncharacterized protein n=1 Tax=Methylomarinum roseum TaxID=3067653 RepID=A0AAU7NXE2_9GAMM|nr:hypothetical protein [Methylomarinum sp. Ch1-1]MDP4522319.1 hypothetical protein [Methylomarinum sp. Ch1-1]